MDLLIDLYKVHRWLQWRESLDLVERYPRPLLSRDVPQKIDIVLGLQRTRIVDHFTLLLSEPDQIWSDLLAKAEVWVDKGAHAKRVHANVL